MKVIFLAFIASFALNAQAEVYKDLWPASSLREIKEKYPNAKFEDVKAAWVRENESFIAMTGVGITGKIFLKLSHTDQFKKNYISSSIKHADDSTSEEERDKFLNSARDMQNLLDAPLEDRLSLDWVRWVPLETIPIERLESRYGKPEKCDYDEDTFTPYCEWASKGLSVSLTDNKKFVMFIEYSFTEADWDAKWGIPRKQKNDGVQKDNKAKPSPKKPSQGN